MHRLWLQMMRAGRIPLAETDPDILRLIDSLGDLTLEELRAKIPADVQSQIPDSERLDKAKMQAIVAEAKMQAIAEAKMQANVAGGTIALQETTIESSQDQDQDKSAVDAAMLEAAETLLLMASGSGWDQRQGHATASAGASSNASASASASSRASARASANANAGASADLLRIQIDDDGILTVTYPDEE